MNYVSLKGILSAAMLAAPFAAHATLGAAPTSQSSGAQITARVVKQAAGAAAPYQIQEITEPSGTVVREYVAGGTVFGVAWQGPTMPVLRDLFGAQNFDRYVQAVDASRASPNRTRGRATVVQSDLVVRSGGRPGAFAGQAYIPNLLPSGVVPADIK